MDRYIIWGTGNYASIYYYWILGMDVLKNNEILCYVDNDVNKPEMFQGKPVIGPGDIHKYEYDYISIWSAKYEKEIKEQIIKQLHIPDSKIRDFFAPYKELLYLKYKNTNDAEINDIFRKMQGQTGLNVYYFDRKKDSLGLNEAHYDGSAGLYYVFLKEKECI